MFIDGQWRSAASGKALEVINPATEEVIATVAAADRKDIDDAVAAARAALDGPWGQLSARERFRATAVAVSVAAAVHALLLGLLPLAVRPAVPRAWWLVVSAAAAIVAVRRDGRDQASDA